MNDDQLKILDLSPNILSFKLNIFYYLKILEKHYEVVEVTPVDQFCYSSHIECVTKLILKSE